MRLSVFEIEKIKKSFLAYFLPQDKLWLFGSRADMNKKGGDIDLYIETDYNDAKQVFDSKIKFICTLENEIGEQKIDVVIKFGDTILPIYEIAKTTGVRII